MTTIPALSGSESVLGFVRESVWGTTPVSGSDPNKAINGIVFFPAKEEGIQAGIDAQPQTDDMSYNREISRIIENGAMNTGGIRFNPGPETLGYLFTMIFGTPETTQLAASSGTDEGAYQHVWYPGQRTRDAWPVPYSIESQYAAVRSKLIQGALCTSLPLEIGNNAVVTASPEFLAKQMIFLGTAAGGMGSGTTNSLGETRPAVMTANPTLIDETPWHFKHFDVTAPWQEDDVTEDSLTSAAFTYAFPGMEGLFTAGSGMNLGTYRVDNFQLSGRATILFANESRWEKAKAGDYFKLYAKMVGDLIQGSYYNQLEITGYSAKVTNPDVVNRVGNLEYDFEWTGRKDPTENKSCTITLINTVSSYA
jgi:hypothetical protein